jgi:homocysteine S-methyltransferase
LGSREDLGPDAYARHVEGWIAAGARLVGGCCEIGPEHIARLREVLS